jgi:nitric oxide reductase large subunit
METATRRGFLLARGWIQAVILVLLFGFFVLGFLAFRTYTGEPPIPAKVIGPDGRPLFTGANIMAGQDFSDGYNGGHDDCRLHAVSKPEITGDA